MENCCVPKPTSERSTKVPNWMMLRLQSSSLSPLVSYSVIGNPYLTSISLWQCRRLRRRRILSHSRPLEPGNLVKREFLPALRRAGLRRITFHSLRHSFTALLIAQGENIKYIQSQLGHASVQTTLDRYGHLLPATHKDAAKRLDATLFGNSVSKPLANDSEVGVTHNGESPEVLELAGLS